MGVSLMLIASGKNLTFLFGTVTLTYDNVELF